MSADDKVTDLMAALERSVADAKMARLQARHDRLLRWIKDWVLTGEMRLDDDCEEDDEIWEEYAGWIPVHEMPAEVQALREES